MKYLVRICGGPRCKENFSEDLIREAKKVIGDREDIELEKGGCMALCHIGPNVKVVDTETNKSTIYNKVGIKEIKDIIKSLKS